MNEEVFGFSENYYEAARGRQQDLVDACKNVRDLVAQVDGLTQRLKRLRDQQEQGGADVSAIIHEIGQVAKKHREATRTLEIFELRVKNLGG